MSIKKQNWYHFSSVYKTSSREVNGHGQSICTISPPIKETNPFNHETGLNFRETVKNYVADQGQ